MNTLDKILSLNRAPTKFGLAPHKPVMLLAVIEAFENGEITENWIEINDNLLKHFYDNWSLFVKTENIPNFSLPFFHLKNEKSKIWELITFPDKEIPTTNSKSIKSFKALNETVRAAQLSDDLFLALSNSAEREELKSALLEKYFGIKSISPNTQITRYSDKITKQILFDPERNYSKKVIRQIQAMPLDSREEIVYLRSAIFRQVVLNIYDYQCSVSGLKVSNVNNTSLVDACHILPFADSYNDSISNGIALSPTFHRAFDRGIISISEDYKVLVHSRLKDFHPDSGIRKFENQPLVLPEYDKYWPSQINLDAHRNRFGFK